VVYSASTSFFIPFLITFVLYAHIFAVLRRRLAAMRVRRRTTHPPETTTNTAATGSSSFLWRLRKRKRASELKSYVDSTLPADLSDDKSTSNDLEVGLTVPL